jgi:hypothetical protein
MQRRRSYSRESLEEAAEQGREPAGCGPAVEAGQEAGSSSAGSEAVRSAMANTRTAELASLAEQADIRWGLKDQGYVLEEERLLSVCVVVQELYDHAEAI